MAKVQVFNKARMFLIEQSAIVAARLSGFNLILTTRGGTDIDVGNVRGAQGNTGTPGTTPNLRATSNTSIAIATGSKTFAISGGTTAFPINSIVRIQNTADPTNYMVGRVTSSSLTQVIVSVDEIGGSGTLSNWVITIGSYLGRQGDQGIQGPEGPIGPIGPSNMDLFRGTAAQRDARFGVPNTLATRVALANQKPMWFNVDEGWWESYYTTTGSAGLTARAIVSSAPSGWYPVGPGPKCRVTSEAGSGGKMSLTATWIFNLWRFTTAGAFNRGGTTWFELYDANRKLRVKRPGLYKFTGAMGFPNGSGTVVVSFSGSPFMSGKFQWPQALLGSYGNMQTVEATQLLWTDAEVYFQHDVGAAFVAGGDEIYMQFEYLGPPFVND